MFSNHNSFKQKIKTSVSQKKERKFSYGYKLKFKVYKLHLVKEVIKMEIAK